MNVSSSIRIPFNVAVDCGFEAVCFARNISKTGIYIEAPRTDLSLKVQAGMDITLLISPFGSSPSAQIQGTIVRVEDIRLPNASPGRGFGVEFHALSDEVTETLQRCIDGYLSQWESMDLRNWARTLFEQFENDSLSQDESGEAVKEFILKLTPRSRELLESGCTKDPKSIGDWALGQVLMVELAVRNIFATAQYAGQSEEQAVREKLRLQIEFVRDSIKRLEPTNITRADEREKIETALYQISTVLPQAGLPFSVDKKDAHAPVVEELQGQISMQFRPKEFYEAYLATHTLPENVGPTAAAQLDWLVEDWKKEIQEHFTLSDLHKSLLNQVQVLALKLSFEARQIFILNPLAHQSSSISPSLRECLSESLELQKKIRGLLDETLQDDQWDEILCLQRAASYLGKAAQEFETFVSSLPLTPEAAEKFYDQPHFRMPEEIQKKKPIFQKFSVSRKAFMRAALCIVIVLFIYSNWAYVWGFLFRFKGKGVGQKLAIQSYTVHKNTWTGKVLLSEWEKFSKNHRWKEGDQLMQTLLSRGFQRAEIRSFQGDLLAKTIFRGQRPEWIVLLTPEEQKRSSAEVSAMQIPNTEP